MFGTPVFFFEERAKQRVGRELPVKLIHGRLPVSTNSVDSGMRTAHLREIRAFNKFYSHTLSTLDGYITASGYSLPEVKIIFELCHNDRMTASDLMMLLEIDKGYLSRILQKLENAKLISRIADKSDGRAVCLQLTAKGKKEYENLNASAELLIRKMYERLSDLECERLVLKMKEIQQLVQKK